MKKIVTIICALGVFLGFQSNIFASSGLLQVGELAPDFSLPASNGETISLSQFRGKKKVVLYFYPKDNTPGCTTEAQNFQGDLSKFEKAGAVVLGVSLDGDASHLAFAKKLKLSFPLLSDSGGNVAKQYGVMGWIMAKRVTYVIGADGKVKAVFPDVDVANHSKEVLKSL